MHLQPSGAEHFTWLAGVLFFGELGKIPLDAGRVSPSGSDLCITSPREKILKSKLVQSEETLTVGEACTPTFYATWHSGIFVRHRTRVGPNALCCSVGDCIGESTIQRGSMYVL